MADWSRRLSRRAGGISLVSAVLLGGGVLLDAQEPTRPPRPGAVGGGRAYRGLFGHGIGSWDQALVAGLTFGGGFGDTRVSDGANATPAFVIPQGRGGFGHAGANLSYHISRQKFGVQASGVGTLGYYPAWTSEVVKRHRFTFGGWVNPFTRTSLATDIQVNYRPVNDLDSLAPWRPDVGSQSLSSPELVTTQGSGVPQSEYLSLAARLTATHNLSLRSSVFAGAGVERSDYPGAAGALSSVMGSGGFSYRLTKDLGVRLAYGQQVGHYPARGSTPGVRRVIHTLDAGVDFNKALSLSRRTTLSFRTGSSALSNNQTTFYHVTGAANLNREIGRTFNADVSYRRGVRLLSFAGDPILDDSGAVSLSGLLGRRVGVSTGLGATRGQVGVTASARGFTVYSGWVRMTLALTGNLALSTNYSYYTHSFDDQAGLVPGLLRDVRRQSLSFNVNLFAPLLTQTRRSNATR